MLASTRPTGHGRADSDLPEVSPALLRAWDAAGEPDWADLAAVLDYLVDGERSLAAPGFDEAAVREMCRLALARARDIRVAVTNHPMADQGPRWRHRLGDVGAPTLILHGEQDPLFPPANARALAAAIPGADIRLYAGVGHELPLRAQADYIDRIAWHVLGVIDDA